MGILNSLAQVQPGARWRSKCVCISDASIEFHLLQLACTYFNWLSLIAIIFLLLQPEYVYYNRNKSIVTGIPKTGKADLS